MEFIVVGIRLSHCFTISISGETYIEPGVPYKVTCTVSNPLDNRKTSYSAKISNDEETDFFIHYLQTDRCVYRALTSLQPCQRDLCSCDMNGLATHWTYNTPTNLSSTTFRCTSKNNELNLNSSNAWIPTVPSKCLKYLW